jgi:micrococcal nuclease
LKIIQNKGISGPRDESKLYKLYISILILSVLITGCGDLTPVITPSHTALAKASSQTTQMQDKKPSAVVKPAAKKPSATPKTGSTTFISAKVLRVVDGDTLVVTIDGKQDTVRLILVDTPETKKPNTPIQPFGPEASAFTKKELEGSDVKLERDVSERDKYKRLLAYVYKGDKMFNELLLEKGLARVAIYPPDVKYIDRFNKIQKVAQASKVGIWSIEDYATDKGYNMEAVQATPKAVSSPTPKPTSVKQSGYVVYSSCAAAKKAGKAPLHKGDAGYSTNLDRDGDGVACE